MIVEPRVHRCLCLWPDQMIGSGDMQHQRMGDAMLFIEHLVDMHAIIADRCAHIGARRRHIGELAARTVANQSDFLDGRVTAHTSADRLDGRFDVDNAIVEIILAEIAERLLQLGLDIGVQFDAGGEAPENLRRDGQIAFARQLVAFLDDPRIDPENLGHDDDRGARRSRWRGDIDAHLSDFGIGTHFRAFPLWRASWAISQALVAGPSPAL